MATHSLKLVHNRVVATQTDDLAATLLFSFVGVLVQIVIVAIAVG